MKTKINRISRSMALGIVVSALLEPDIGEREGKNMKRELKYTSTPVEVRESLNRAVVIPNFSPTPEQVEELSAKRAKKPVSIYLTVETIEKFKIAAKKDGGRYQTMISNVLDAYTQQHLS